MSCILPVLDCIVTAPPRQEFTPLFMFADYTMLDYLNTKSI